MIYWIAKMKVGFVCALKIKSCLSCYPVRFFFKRLNYYNISYLVVSDNSKDPTFSLDYMAEVEDFGEKACCWKRKHLK